MDKVFLLMRAEHGDNTILGAYSTWRTADKARKAAEKVSAVELGARNDEEIGRRRYSFYVEELEVQP